MYSILNILCSIFISQLFNFSKIDSLQNYPTDVLTSCTYRNTVNAHFPLFYTIVNYECPLSTANCSTNKWNAKYHQHNAVRELNTRKHCTMSLMINKDHLQLINAIISHD